MKRTAFLLAIAVVLPLLVLVTSAVADARTDPQRPEPQGCISLSVSYTKARRAPAMLKGVEPGTKVWLRWNATTSGLCGSVRIATCRKLGGWRGPAHPMSGLVSWKSRGSGYHRFAIACRWYKDRSWIRLSNIATVVVP